VLVYRLCGLTAWGYLPCGVLHLRHPRHSGTPPFGLQEISDLSGRGLPGPRLAAPPGGCSKLLRTVTPPIRVG